VSPTVRRVLRRPDREAQRVEWARFTRRWYCMILVISAGALALMAAAGPPWWLWPIVGVSALFALRRIVALSAWLHRESVELAGQAD
jgi:membrane protein YdbS with pleckstrin-like domain